MTKIGVFIDMQNIYMSIKSQFNNTKRVNWERLRQYFYRKNATTTLTVMTYYDPENTKQIAFLKALGTQGYRIITKPIMEYYSDWNRREGMIVKANMDMEIAIEIISQAEYLDQIVLITGDGDFKALIDYMVRKGKKVTVIGPDKTTSSELIMASHNFYSLQDIPDIYIDNNTNNENTDISEEHDTIA